jgi:hypothetical protein
MGGWWPRDYYLDTLLITTTSRTPITVQIDIPPPIHPFIIKASRDELASFV